MNADKFVPQHSHFDFAQCKSLSTQHSALSTQHSQLSTPNSALSTQHSQLSTPNSALSTQHSALFTFRPYQRKFARPLTTHHGVWDMREGIILRLVDEVGNVGWGEIAPISWFASETLEQALDFCRQLPKEITSETIFAIPDDLPACQFGFESAFEGVGSGKGGRMVKKSFPPHSPHSPHPLPIREKFGCSGLLAAGEVALQQWQKLWEEGYRTFKWKIGVDAIATELAIFDNLCRSLPASAKLRLDANGGLSYEEAELWLETCDKIQGEVTAEIEFLEQPLPVKDLAGMLELSKFYRTAIALDESVATLQQLLSCYQQGWRGIFVLKPGIIGSPSKLRQFCQQHEIDAVFSSVFETVIGRQAALNLAAELSRKNRAVGFGVDHFFAQAAATNPENLWNNL
ncbi:o-succinylbenzoate synthase [Nostoc sp. FACHB-87]|uniref:o-succinylbenzoate synthase n=1 Tax=Nostocaceae TaxID=1162 RepID=UPI0016868ED9|nr:MULTISPECIES: o-succinylbenzoate synthase [Nostocaceae]MBD2455516.1 o-succinylbenzoate synthase [Nostoc sp. FACHB-87]MBD2478591.1 o-succinylbenzoate synthase [Anabaena sp. FACHB-83]